MGAVLKGITGVMPVNATALRNSRRYRKARATFLGREPLCRKCRANGLRVAATDLDHIQPVHTHPDLFWDTSNWQPLCRKCHADKTLTENEARWGRDDKWNAFNQRLAEMVAKQPTETDYEAQNRRRNRRL